MTARCLALLAVFSICFPNAEAAVLGFEDFAPAGGLVNIGPANPYSEANFTVTPSNADSAVFDSAGTTTMPGNNTDFFGFQEGNTITLAMDGFGTFSFLSLDLGISNLATAASIDFTIVGTLFGGGTMMANFTNISTSTNAALNWDNLMSVTISATDDAAIDNLNVVIPEPSTITLALLALAVGCGWQAGARRRRP